MKRRVRPKHGARCEAHSSGRKPPAQREDFPPGHHLLYLRTQPIAVLFEETREKRRRFFGMPTKELEETLWHGLLELAERVKHPRLSVSRHYEEAQWLAGIAGGAANLLEGLAFCGIPEAEDGIAQAASGRTEWPVNLQLTTCGRKGKACTQLRGTAHARDFLTRIRLGGGGARPRSSLLDRDGSIFKKAAELVFSELLDWREHHAPLLVDKSAWAKRLLVLEPHMDRLNVEEWWKVAKEWLYALWDSHHHLFEPLVRSMASGGRPLAEVGLYPAERKTRVIDSRLQEAFRALATRADL